jgi:ferritin-like metal-binding protein YciE
MQLKSLEDLFVHSMRDMYYAEKQILKTLPRMAKKTDSDALRAAFEEHLEETEGQIARLEKVFELVEQKARGMTCPGINGIIEEGKEVMEDTADPDTMDAGLIASAQAVEHYEICRYGTMVAWAKELGMNEAARLLQQNLDEEYGADRKLSALAEGRLNREAAA